VFHIGSGKTVSISGLTITDGNGASGNGGGGILNDHATLAIDNCAVQNSFALDYNYGGGVYNDGSAGSAALTILNSAITSNHAYSAGGGIYNDASNGGSATLTITNSSVSDNNAAFINKGFSGGEGGGIYNGGGTVMITNSSVNGNSAGLDDPSPLVMAAAFPTMGR
jgi:fibronectin-binding autotransporter adhesin